ncbi:MAG TPA: hypothetical protein VND19_17440 [Acetobacteraceae bacterium]|nr:hypothetical protein [Acetobacteraceae bacterium]
MMLSLEIMAAILGPLLLLAWIAYFRRWRFITLLAVAVLFGGYHVVESSDAFQRLYWRWTLPTLPPDETAFIAAADELHALRTEPATRNGRAAALRRTEARLCALPVVADDWVGRVAQMYLTSSGHGASLMIGIWPHLVVRTAFFPDDTGTLIRAGSPVFARVVSLRSGDVVRFSGRIVGHAGACPADPPVDRNEKLRDPEILFRFAQVEKRPAH